MEKLSWVRDLVLAEQTMEDKGLIEFETSTRKINLSKETILFLQTLKSEFIESASLFNKYKTTQVGTLKIYGISNTKADFMLFRNGFKLTFSMTEPGTISICLFQLGNNFSQQTAQTSSTNLIVKTGAFDELIWTCQGHMVKVEKLVEYYVSRFVRASVK